MKSKYKTREQLIKELKKLQKQVTKLEKSQTECMYAKGILKQSEERYKKLVEKAKIAIVIDDEKGNFKYFNKRFAKMFGYTVGEIKKKSIQTLVHPDDTERVMKFHKDRIRGRKVPTRYEFKGVRKDGTTIYLEVAAEKLKKGKNIIGTHSYIWDITDRKQAQGKLHYQADLLQNVSNAIISTNLDFNITTWNKAAEIMYGWQAYEVVGKSIHKIIKSVYPFVQWEDVLEEIFKKDYWKGEVIQKCKDGTNINVLSAISLTKDSAENPVGTVMITHDITERKRADVEMRKARDELEIRVKKRTAELIKTNEVLLFEINGRKRMEEAIKVAYAELNQIFNAAGDGMCVFDKDFNILRINETFSILLHINRDEAVGRKCYEIFPGPLCHTPQCPLNRILNGEQRIEREMVRVLDDGTQIICLITTTAFRGPDGELIGIVETLKDITRAKQIEQATKNAAQQWRITFDAIHDAVSLLDTERKIQRCNMAMKKMLGMSFEEIIGNNCCELMHDLQKPIDECPLSRMMKSKRRELQAVQSGDQWFNISVDPLLDESGNITGAVHIVTDITDQKRGEDQIIKQNVFMNNILDSLAHPFYVIDVNNYTIKMANAVAYKGDLPKNLKCYEFIHKQGRPCSSAQHRCPIEEIKRAKKPVTVEHVHYDKNNHPRYYDVHGYPIFDNDGNVVQMIEYTLDITERRMMEEELLKAQKLESVGFLAGGIAHDFNNILTSILGNIEIAKMGLDQDNKITERLTKAEKATLQAKNLTQQLLTFSKGGVPVKKVVSVSELLRESANFALRGSNVRVKFSSPDNLWSVEVDEGQVSQVISNLIINADQAMPKGGIIELFAENVTAAAEDSLPLKNGKYVKISIKDHGTGISEEHLPKIFDPFFTTKKKGSGLGLATSYSIVKKHGGCITVESQLGAGTTFSIYVPATKKKIPEQGYSKEKILFGKGRVLVMDDEEPIRELVAQMLSHCGYEVTTVKDGVEAIELYKKERDNGRPFDVVIMDLTIPGGMGGKEATQRLLEIDPGVKVIVSSGYSNDPIMADYKKYGFCGVIAKPYRIKELSEVLKKAITGKNK